MYEKIFKVDNITYKFMVYDNSISFSIIKGCSKRGSFGKFIKDALFRPENEYDDLNISMSPFKVFSKVTELAIDWIRAEKPYVFSFGSSSPRKRKIYSYLVNKAFKANKDISDKYNNNVADNGNFIFYRRNNKQDL